MKRATVCVPLIRGIQGVLFCFYSLVQGAPTLDLFAGRTKRPSAIEDSQDREVSALVPLKRGKEGVVFGLLVQGAPTLDLPLRIIRGQAGS